VLYRFRFRISLGGAERPSGRLLVDFFGVGEISSDSQASSEFECRIGPSASSSSSLTSASSLSATSSALSASYASYASSVSSAFFSNLELDSSNSTTFSASPAVSTFSALFSLNGAVYQNCHRLDASPVASPAPVFSC
jgi:hypothetical protein